jgi:glycine/D-amino acid oxidase-like deaminating enzyme
VAPSFNIPEQTALAVAALRLFEAGTEPDVVLGVMRRGGLGLIDSMRVWSEAAGIGLVEAKRVVLASRAWAPGFAKDKTLQQAIADAQDALVIDAGEARDVIAGRLGPS